MSFNFKNTETKETKGFSPQFISYGINLLKINYIELKESKTGKVQIRVWVEGPEQGKDFSGAELPDKTKAKGLVGKVNLGIYFDPNDEFKLNTQMNNLMYIAEKAGVDEQVKSIEADTLEDLLQKYTEIIKGKFVWFVVKGEEYEKGKFSFAFKEGKIGKDDSDRDIYQVFCKHPEFKQTEESDEDGRIIKIKGTNKVGKMIGKIDTMEFNPAYDLKSFEASDEEDDGLGSSTTVDAADAF